MEQKSFFFYISVVLLLVSLLSIPPPLINNSLQLLFQFSDAFIPFENDMKNMENEHFSKLFSALLCGLSGYAAFIDENIAKEIVQWQNINSGCFEYFDGSLSNSNDDSSTKKIVKRFAALLPDNCSDHFTGLAAATFGLFAKISNHFQNTI